MRIVEAIREVVDRMDDRTRGLVVAFLKYGRKISRMDLDEGDIKRMGREADAEEIAALMNKAFLEGHGLWDRLKGRSDNYGAQLDEAVKVLSRGMKVEPPVFMYGSETMKGIEEREEWIVETINGQFWDELPDDAKVEILTNMNLPAVDRDLILRSLRAGKDTIVLLRQALGFRFHVFAARLANLLAKAIVGRGLSLSANAALQKALARFFGGGGFLGTVLMVANIVDTVWRFVNPRQWDRYIPAVYLIGSYRIYLKSPSYEEEKKPLWIIVLIVLIALAIIGFVLWKFLPL